MRKSKILAKIRAGKPAKFGMLGHFYPPYIAHAAQLGYDGIWLEMEHRVMNPREVQALLAFFHLYDIDCLVRPPTTDKPTLYRYLEDGATGLIMPQVPNLEAARNLVNKVKFPPVGDRGLEGRGLETNFGIDLQGDRQRLIDHALQETMLIIQIENPETLHQVDEIAALDGVDAVFIGPADLGLRMGLQPEDSRLTPAEVMDKVAEACRKHGKAWGSMPATLDQARDFAARGAQLIPWRNDIALMVEALNQCSRDLDEIFAGNG